jgi:ribosomal-protein-alanine N-acetyltransferase
MPRVLIRTPTIDDQDEFVACMRVSRSLHRPWITNISEIVRGPFKSAFLGYGGVAGYERRGYMTEALQLVLRQAFTKLGLHRLEANIQPGNTASIALAKRCGFELEGFSPRYLKVGGRWRDHERWAIRAESWRALR